jgi:hypothetical protein
MSDASVANLACTPERCSTPGGFQKGAVTADGADAGRRLEASQGARKGVSGAPRRGGPRSGGAVT